MKILHINSYYSTSSFYKNLYDKQIEKGIDIDVYVPVSNDFKSENKSYGEYTKISFIYNKYDRFIFSIKHKKIYDDIINKYNIKKYDLVHAHSLFSNGYIALKLKENFNIPYIVAVRNTDVNIFFKRMLHLRKIGIEILSKSDRIVFLSKSYRDELIKKYVPYNLKEIILSKSSIIANGIDNFWLDNRRENEKKCNQDYLKLLYVGVINKNKNITTTIKAMEIIRTKGFNVNLTIVGPIKDKFIYKKIKKLNYIKYIEPKPKEELLEIYRKNDIFVMPSIHETFGLVYGEAMSQRLPVVYSKGQGFDGQFKNGRVGYSINCFNYKEIAESIINIIKNYDNISKECVECCNNFSWNKIAEKYDKIYYNILINNLRMRKLC